MLFSIKFIKTTKKPFYFLDSILPVKNFPSISFSWLKKTSYKINQGTFIYRKNSLKKNSSTLLFKNLIIEISFIMLLKIIEIKENNLCSYNKFYESLRFFCN